MDRFNDLPARYEDDFVQWLEHQTGLIRRRQFEQLDVTNLLEELGGMVSREHRELGSRLEVLIAHLLKCEYQPHRKSTSWLNTLDTQRSHLQRLIAHSPSLRRLVPGTAEQEYKRAVRRAERETRLPAKAFPTSLPYTGDQLLDPDFVP